MKRLPISKALRFAIFARDRFTCQYCGERAPDVILHVDHIYPVAAGGTNEADNLITACEACNLGKGAAILDGEAGHEMAIACAMMLAACQRFNDNMPPDAFDILCDFSRMGGPRPHLIGLVRRADSWVEAMGDLYRNFGYPRRFWDIAA